MKNNLLHICFVLDESGSMFRSMNDVLGGFRKLITEQKEVKEGECIVSLYRFASDVKRDYIGLSVSEVPDLVYSPSGMTAMNDGIGTAIDDIGKWLNDMPESERPSKNLIVIMTDGEENYSRDYSFEDVRERIKHQEEKYSWSFIYMGTDISSFDDADQLGISLKSVSGRGNIINNYNHINKFSCAYRVAATQDDVDCALADISTKLNSDTTAYLANEMF